jgi:hypothetical protein
VESLPQILRKPSTQWKACRRFSANLPPSGKLAADFPQTFHPVESLPQIFRKPSTRWKACRKLSADLPPGGKHAADSPQAFHSVETVPQIFRKLSTRWDVKRQRDKCRWNKKIAPRNISGRLGIV